MGSTIKLHTSDQECPVPLDMLGRLHRADPVQALELVNGMRETARIDLALFCYARDHLRDLALGIAGRCDALRLEQRAGKLGEVLARQSREGSGSFGRDVIRYYTPKKVSLAGRRPAA